jgi:tRNA(fMet)-specific endonuclease VapC
VSAYLFDTNTISALVHQRRGFQGLAARIEALRIGERLISAITQSELETIIAKAADPARKSAGVRLILSQFRLVDFDEAAALHAGRIRAYLEPRGQAIGPLDTLIAAHARSLGACVVTDNTGEFSRVPELGVENWLR